jgi:hypothetical protein
LWATFGIDQITPYDENFSRDEMKRWKTSDRVKKAHDDLYSPISSNIGKFFEVQICAGLRFYNFCAIFLMKIGGDL